MRLPARAALLAIALASGWSLPTLAATAKPPAATAPARPPPVQPPAPLPSADPPYEAQLLRLSEILGALHYLRPLCGSSDGAAWREQMQALIDTEQPDDDRRRRMVDRFNRGYESFHSVYRICTAAAGLAAERYLDEGGKITTEITARYGK